MSDGSANTFQPIDDLDELPPAGARICPECPWRRASAPGWLGGLSPDEWRSLAASDNPIACHMTIPDGGGWGPNTLQCRGGATFRRNVFKLPRDPEDAAREVEADRVTVFGSYDEFVDHHSVRPT